MAAHALTVYLLVACNGLIEIIVKPQEYLLKLNKGNVAIEHLSLRNRQIQTSVLITALQSFVRDKLYTVTKYLQTGKLTK